MIEVEAQLELAKRRAERTEDVCNNDDFLLKQPFVSIVAIYPDGTPQEEIQKFILALPSHEDIEFVLVANSVAEEEKYTIGWREGRITSAIHDVPEFEFDTCRNTALHIARGEWIVSLDLDEKLLTTGQKLVDSLRVVPANVDSLRVTNVSLKTTNGNTPEAYASGQIRIFRKNNYIRWQGRCHETLEYTVAKTAQSYFIIQHLGYLTSGENLLRKLERNLLLLCKEVLAPRTEQTKRIALKYICMTGRDLAPAFT